MDNKITNLVIASDHAGYELKNFIKEILTDNYKIEDLGAYNTDSVDYPDYAKALAEFIKLHSDYQGILICGSGIGISIAANRYKHIRAALCHNEITAKLSRMHNDANVIAFGARIIDPQEAITAIKAFLSTPFEKGRHQTRTTKLSHLPA